MLKKMYLFMLHLMVISIVGIASAADMQMDGQTNDWKGSGIEGERTRCVWCSTGECKYMVTWWRR